MLFAVWVWPLPSAGAPPFSAHMVMHMGVVAVAAPLFALGIAGGRWDPVRRAPGAFGAIAASMVELVAVWAWHAPALHHAARSGPAALVAEQSTFLAAGLFLWVSAVGGAPEQRRLRATGAVTGLLLTAMHMTLLGALLALTPRVLYGHGSAHAQGTAALVSPLLDQQLGGAIMIVVGGATYTAGALWLLADVLALRGARGDR